MSKMAAILKFFKSHLLPNSMSGWAETCWEASGWNGESRIAESFSSNTQDDGHGGNLETLQTTSDSELLKAVWSDSQDGHHGTM